MHISSQGDGKIGHHSEYIEEIPEYVIEIKEGIDLMVEAKRKEKAIKRLKERYGERVGYIEKEEREEGREEAT